jgi:hypothetical protein
METVEGYDTDMPVIAVITTGDTEEIIQTGTEYRCFDPFIHDPNDTFNKESQVWKRLNLDKKNSVAPFLREGDCNFELGVPYRVGETNGKNNWKPFRDNSVRLSVV